MNHDLGYRRYHGRCNVLDVSESRKDQQLDSDRIGVCACQAATWRFEPVVPIAEGGVGMPNSRMNLLNGLEGTTEAYRSLSSKSCFKFLQLLQMRDGFAVKRCCYNKYRDLQKVCRLGTELRTRHTREPATLTTVHTTNLSYLTIILMLNYSSHHTESFDTICRYIFDNLRSDL
jgi:hypothetical protein